MTINQANHLHQRALTQAKYFKQSQARLIDILQCMEEKHAFKLLGYTSLFQYCTKALGLSESMASNFIVVSRKARQIPEIKEAIHEGTLTVTKVRRISSVVDQTNKSLWIEKAKRAKVRERR